MRKNLLFYLIIIFITFCSWAMAKHRLPNANSWSISIGKKILLGSSKNNEMGDTVVVNMKDLKPTDTLFVQRYLCGSSGKNSITTLTIKNQQNEIVGEAINIDNHWGLSAEIPLAKIFSSNKFTKGELLSVFFSIDKTNNLNQKVLLGRLKIK